MPIDVRSQKAYNFAYGGVWQVTRMVKFLERFAREYKDDRADSSKGMRDVLAQCGDEFAKLHHREGARCFATAATAIAEAVADWEKAVELLVAGELDEAGSLFAAVREKLEGVKRLLREESPIKFRLWLFNPWRYYPTRLD